MPKQPKTLVPPQDEITNLADKIAQAQLACQRAVVADINAFIEKYPDANLAQISMCASPNLERTIDRIAELAGWCYLRLGDQKTSKAIRKALGYNDPRR